MSALNNDHTTRWPADRRLRFALVKVRNTLISAGNVTCDARRGAGHVLDEIAPLIASGRDVAWALDALDALEQAVAVLAHCEGEMADALRLIHSAEHRASTEGVR